MGASRSLERIAPSSLAGRWNAPRARTVHLRASLVTRAPGMLSASNVRSYRCSAAATENSSSSLLCPSGKNVIATLRERGLVQDITSPDLETIASSRSLKVYCGFDPTAESLHLGNLLGIIVLSWFQRHGHTPVALLGGATGRVGDPSGKSAERPVMSEETIERNTRGIEATLRGLLGGRVERDGDDRQGGNVGAQELRQPVIVNNLDWFGSMQLLTFLRDVGKYARVGTMIGKESVKKRMESESGISYTEFTYQLLQGYDFVHLSREMGIQVQIGGSDQWGNIVAGTELARKMSGREEGSEGHGVGESDGEEDKQSTFENHQHETIASLMRF